MVSGMALGRAAIFVGSDVGADRLRKMGCCNSISATLPPLCIGVFVSVVNQPFVRSTVMLQDPQCSLGARSRFPNLAIMKHFVSTQGLGSLWLGTNAAILKTVPKFITAIAVRDAMEKVLPPADRSKPAASLNRSLQKSVVAGCACAVLTNPVDVVRNEMFKTSENLVPTYLRLRREEGLRWLLRGCEKNIIAVAAPITGTIFMAEIFSAWLRGRSVNA